MRSEIFTRLHAPVVDPRQTDLNGYVVKVGPKVAEALRAAVGKCEPRVAEVMAKDLLLVEAALDSDRRIVSRDTAARQCFADLATSRNELRGIHWSCPSEQACLVWLDSGVPDEVTLQLGE